MRCQVEGDVQKELIALAVVASIKEFVLMNIISSCEFIASILIKSQSIVLFIQKMRVKHLKIWIFAFVFLDFLSLIDVYQLFYSKIDLYFWLNLAFCATLLNKVPLLFRSAMVIRARLPKRKRPAPFNFPPP